MFKICLLAVSYFSATEYAYLKVLMKAIVIFYQSTLTRYNFRSTYCLFFQTPYTQGDIFLERAGMGSFATQATVQTNSSSGPIVIANQG